MSRATPNLLFQELSARWQEVRGSSPGAGMTFPSVGVGAAAITVGTALLTRPLGASLPTATAQRWGWSAQLAIDGEPWRILTAIPLTRDPFMLASMCVSLILAVGALEVLAGHRRALASLIAGAVLGYAGVSAVVIALRETPVVEAAAWVNTVDYGASAGIAACSATIAALLRVRIFTTIAIGIIIGGLLLHHQIADWEHAGSFGILYTVTRCRMGDLRRTEH